MAKIYNSDLSKELNEGAKIQVSFDKTPSELAEKVVPVMEVNPKLLRRITIIKTATAVNSSSATIYTTPNDKDFFLVAAEISVIKDVTATSTASNVTFTLEDGNSATILNVAGLSLTVQNIEKSFCSNNPIKLKRNTVISLTNNTNVANVKSIATIYGYLVDNINA